MIDYNDIISNIYYNMESKNDGMFKVYEYLGKHGSTHYYNIMFKATGNVKKCSRSDILRGDVKDTEYYKKETKKRNKAKKKLTESKRKLIKGYIMAKQDEIVNSLVLDLATISTGYAVWRDNSLVTYGYIYISPDDSLVERINYIKCKIIDLIDNYKITAVCLENFIKGMHNDNILVPLAELHGVVKDLLYEEDIPYCLIESIEWKTYIDINKHYTSKANSREVSKLRTLERIKEVFNIDCIKMCENIPKEHLDKKVYEDIADALGISKLYIEQRIKRTGG